MGKINDISHLWTINATICFGYSIYKVFLWIYPSFISISTTFNFDLHLKPPAIEDNVPDEKDPPLEADVNQAVAKEEVVAKEAEKEEEEAGPNMVEPENAEEVEEQVKREGN